MTLDPKTSCDFKFPLTEDDIIRANCLKDMLQELEQSDSKLKATIDALHNFIKPLLYPKAAPTSSSVNVNPGSLFDKEELFRPASNVSSYRTAAKGKGRATSQAVDDNVEAEGRAESDDDNEAEGRAESDDDDSEDELENYESDEEDDTDEQIPTDRWDQPFEWFLALHSLRADGTFRSPKEVTTMFAMVHHHIRDAMVYAGVRAFKSGHVSNVYT